MSITINDIPVTVGIVQKELKDNVCANTMELILNNGITVRIHVAADRDSLRSPNVWGVGYIEL